MNLFLDTLNFHNYVKWDFYLHWWWFSRSVVSDSCDLMDCSSPGNSFHGILQTRIQEWGSHSLLQGIFPTQGSNPGIPHWGLIPYCLNHQGSPNEQSGDLQGLTHPAMGAEPNRRKRDSSFFLTRTQLVKSHRFPVYCSPPIFLFPPSIKRFSFPFPVGPCMWLTMVVDPKLQFSADSK